MKKPLYNAQGKLLGEAIDGTRTRAVPLPPPAWPGGRTAAGRKWGLVLPPTSVYVYGDPFSPVKSILFAVYTDSLTSVYVYGKVCI